MKENLKDEKISRNPPHDKMREKTEPPLVCEICGETLERDPESGEYYCPACFYTEHES